MNMKRLLVILLFPWWVAMAPAQGAETDVLFRASDGKLILPYLRIGEEIYYVELILVDLDNLLFQVSLSSIAVITPADPGSVADQSAILGTWSDTGYSFTLNSDGSYVYVTTSSDTGCPLGTEQGTFQWEPATGVFLTVPGVDENGTCGFSHTSGIQRLSVDGNLLHYATSSHSSDLASGFDGPDGDDHGDATHSLSVTKSGNGSGNVSSSQQPGINCGSNCSFSFDDDTTVTLTATPDSGSYLFGWGNCTSVGGNGGTICNVTVGSDKTVEAIFVSTLLTVSTAGTGSGNVVSSNAGINCGVFGSACAHSFPVGTTASLQALAASGSTFAGWSGGCTSITGANGSICNVLITAGQSFNVTVTASFTKNPN